MNLVFYFIHFEMLQRDEPPTKRSTTPKKIGINKSPLSPGKTRFV